MTYSFEHLAGMYADARMTDAELSARMDFDHVIEVRADGTIADAPDNVYAPGLWDDDLSDSSWSLLNGYSGQYRYSGPIMHSSEYIGGRMERDILATPGYYVAIIAYAEPFSGDADPDEDDNVVGWAVARRDVTP